MAKREQLFRLFDIIDVVKKNHKGATYDQIYSYVESQHQLREDEFSDISFSKKTFKRDRDLIFDLFGIEFTFRKSTHTYQIDEEEDLDHANQIYDNLLLVNAYRKTKNESDILLFERRQASGLHNLEGIIYAIKNRKIITFTYQKYWDDTPTKRVVESYAVKEFKNRWYLLAIETTDSKKTVKTFGLDRISDLDISTKTFSKKSLDINSMFSNSFGIISTEGQEPKKIVLSFDHYQGKFVKTLPLHHSQKILIDNADEFRIELTLVPTYDFYQELLSHAERLTIVEPQQVKKEYIDFLKISLNKNK